MSGITPAWKGEVWLADFGIRLPALKGTKLDAPENFRAEMPISNAVVPVNYVAGLQFPILKIPLSVTSNWYYVSLLNGLLGVPYRSEPVLAGIGGWYGTPRDITTGDLSSVGRIQFWNGATAWELEGCKCCEFVISNKSLGNYIQGYLCFWGVSIQSIGWAQTQAPFTLRKARSQNCGHNLPVNPTEWAISVRNPLAPNAVLLPIPPPGNERFFAPLELNSGTLEVEVSMMFQAHHQWGGVADGVPFYLRVVPPSGVSVGLNVTNPLWSDRYSADFGTDRQKAPLRCVGRGNADGTSPLVIV